MAAATAPVEIWRATVEDVGATDQTLRRILSRYMDTAPSALQFEAGVRGKPRLLRGPGVPDVRYSVSHSGAVWLAAVTVGRDIGIDVERVDVGDDSLAPMERFFTDDERALLEALPPRERRRTRVQLWTGKEAVLKATGEGITPGLARLDVSPLARGQAVVRQWHETGDAQPRKWCAVPIPFDAGYAVALAVEGETPPSFVLRDASAAG